MSVVSVTELIEAVTVVADPATTFNENIKQVGGTAVATGVGASDAGTMRVALSSDSQVAPNVANSLIDYFYNFNNGTIWNLSLAEGDFSVLDGNCAASSYLVISKSPFNTQTSSTLTSVNSFAPPFETSAGLSISARVLGQEISCEMVDLSSTLPVVENNSITSIQQTTTSLTVTTANPHGLQSGDRIGIFGVTSDSRLNYPCLVVGQVVSTTSFTATAGPMGTIGSLTVGPFTNQGTLYYRPSLGYAPNGTSDIFENATATNSSVYVRANSGDVLPSGTLTGSHSVTASTTASTQLTSNTGQYNFFPTSEYRYIYQADRFQLTDVAVDSIGSQNNRYLRTQVVPEYTKTYNMRFRVTNDGGITTPTAEIVSAVKSGSVTATVTTATPHGLTTGDYVVVMGTRDQTNFAYSATGFQVLSTPTSTSFTAQWGISATATSYGGYVARVQGQNVPVTFITQSIQSLSITNSIIYATANTTLTNVQIGDHVNLYGVRNTSTGASLGLDGIYKVRDVSASAISFVPVQGTSIPASLGSTNCGGGIIKRVDFRLSFAKVFDYTRERVEVLAQPASAVAVPVNMVAGTLGSGTITTVQNASLNSNNIVADITSAAITTTTTSAAIAPAASALSQEFNVIVTAVSGTNPTLDVVVQESDDSGTNWYDTYHFPRITATGQYRSPLIPLTGNRIRYVRTVAGTSPSFTNAVNRIQSHTSNPVQRQFFDRSGIAVNTLNSATPAFFTEGCVDINVVVVIGAVTTTAPVLVYETSPDNFNWVQLGADITTAANTNNILQVSNAQARFSRLRVKTAGSGATLGYIMVKGVGK